MIIKNYELTKNNILNNKIFLLYGENEGYKNQIINDVILNNNKFDVTKYDESEILENYEEFIQNLLNKSFFENEKKIIINRVTDKSINFVEELIQRKIYDNTIIFVSEILQKKSKIRNIFEKEKELVCVPFYLDNNKTLSIIANNFFKEKKIKVSQEIINLIVDRSMGERKNLFIELNKIENYSKDKKSISYEEILKLTNIAENYSTSELIDNCLSKKINKTVSILNENNYSHEDCILILRTLLFKCKRLLKIKNNLTKNNNIESAISEYKPPIFWKEKETIKTQNICWSTNSIKILISETYKLEVLVKKNTSNSLNIISDFLLNKANKI
tara:strand:- start:2236 stop:3225 length:990 start_codon:yes stop_codon:yes gene_type:complete